MTSQENKVSPRGFFGVAVYRPKTEINVGTLWRTASLYGAAFLATVGRRYTRQSSDTPKSSLHTPLHHYTDLADLLDHLPWSCPLIGVELVDDAIPLNRYTHPPRALYLLGAEDNGLSPETLKRCHQVVSIPSALPYSMNVAVAGSIVIYDRFFCGLGALAMTRQ